MLSTTRAVSSSARRTVAIATASATAGTASASAAARCTSVLRPYVQSRTLFSFKWLKSKEQQQHQQSEQSGGFFGGSRGKSPASAPVTADANSSQRLGADNLFHKLSESPIREIRERGKLIAQHNPCPVGHESHSHDHQHLDTDGNPTAVNVNKQPLAFECPDCGYPTHCSEEHYLQDRDNHRESGTCRRLREANTDEHDLRSGRVMAEFEFPAAQHPDYTVNLSSWQPFMFTRGFRNADSPRSLRHVSKLLTYPITIGAVLHALSPFTTSNGRLTVEGSRSLAALRHTIAQHESVDRTATTTTAAEISGSIPRDAIRVFILGARAESMLPQSIFVQLQYLLPHSPISIHFMGPEVIQPPPHGLATDSSSGGGGSSPLVRSAPTYISPRMCMSYSNSVFHEGGVELYSPYDPYTDIFFLFAPGIGHPATRDLWRPTLKLLWKTKCPVVMTGFHEEDMMADVAELNKVHKEEIDWLITPGPNPMASLKADINPADVREYAYTNWGLFAVRGKKYEVRTSQNEEEDD
ncbi:hypothetical protein GQ42DRAFT_90133 [Ramicandelaber brevisporus]|nr:hypothetical protein GQ42DRAFT_90133 [Ramicandelaber brevisporus]